MASASPLDAVGRSLRAEIKAYPGSITFVDLMRRSRRDSAFLIVLMMALGVAIGAALGGLAATGAQGLDPVPSALLGGGVALVIATIGCLTSYFSGDKMILRAMHAREVTRDLDPELFNVVDEMRLAAGLPMPRVYLIPESAMNAFATGRDPAHASIGITTGLRSALTRDELQGVIAHEMAHVRHYDIRFAMLMATMAGLIVFACDLGLRSARMGAFHGRRSSRDKGEGAAGMVILVIVLILAIVAPIIARMIQMAYSRQREYLADAGAVELTRNPEGLASALSKLAMDREPLVDLANRGTAHLFIVNPLRSMRESGQTLSSMFCSHPPVKDRIARLLALMR